MGIPTINRFELGGQHLAAQFGAASIPTSGPFASPTAEAAQHRATPGPKRKLQVFSDLHHDVNRHSHPGTAGPLAVNGVGHRGPSTARNFVRDSNHAVTHSVSTCLRACRPPLATTRIPS
jgi:hypothetical protein